MADETSRRSVLASGVATGLALTGGCLRTLSGNDSGNQTTAPSNDAVRDAAQASSADGGRSVYHASFEDGNYDGWRVLWLQGGNMSDGTQSGEQVPLNDWSVAREHPGLGTYALHLHCEGDGNALATTDRVVDLSGDYDLEYSFYTPDPKSRGMHLLAVEVPRYGSSDDLVTQAIPRVNLGSAHRSPYNDVHANARALGFSKRLPLDAFPAGTMTRIRVERRGDTVRFYRNGDLLAEGPIDLRRTSLDLSKNHQLLLRSSGGYGEESNVWVDDIYFVPR